MKDQIPKLSKRQLFCLEQREKVPNVCLNDNPNVSWPCGLNIHHSVMLCGHGFGYENIDGKILLIPHTGKIVIENDVEIHAYTVVCPGTGDNDITFIGEGTKIDTRCHIAHNVKIGRNVVITSGVTIGGSAVIEDDVYIGIGAVIRNKIKIGKGAVIGMGAVVVNDIPENVTVVGNPAKILAKPKTIITNE